MSIFLIFQVEKTETSEEPISHELTNPPEAIQEEVVETTEVIVDTSFESSQLEHIPEEEDQDNLSSPNRTATPLSVSASSRSSPTPSSSSSSIPSTSEEIKDESVSVEN